MSTRRLTISALVTAFTLTLTGCLGIAPQRSDLNIHLLDQSAMSAETLSWENPERILRLHRIELPEHLDQASILYRDRSGIPVVLDGDVWTEPLGDAIARVLARQIEGRVPGLSVVPYPFTGDSNAERWRIAFRHFEAWEGRGVVLEAALHWNDPETGESRQARIREVFGEGDYESAADIVAEMFLALDFLAEKIAARL